MDREKVINDLQDAVNDDWIWRHADYYALTMERAIDLLKDQEQGWVPVGERLPETGKAVLVCCDGKFHDAMVVAYIDALGLWHPISGDHIAYWMPLPEPPKDGDGDG